MNGEKGERQIAIPLSAKLDPEAGKSNFLYKRFTTLATNLRPINLVYFRDVIIEVINIFTVVYPYF
ncbi:hypothetical protein SAMN05443252_10857 [Bacillus sp. OV322]|nr:hypothetical protein SAMN05443252_10857 [Bacillus sp. OV322]